MAFAAEADDPAADDPEADPAADDPAADPEADDPAADFMTFHSDLRCCCIKARSRGQSSGPPIVCRASAVVRSRGGPADPAGPLRKKKYAKIIKLTNLMAQVCV